MAGARSLFDGGSASETDGSQAYISAGGVGQCRGPFVYGTGVSGRRPRVSHGSGRGVAASSVDAMSW